MFGARIAFLLGNFITGLAVLAPAGMVQPLADGLAVSIREVGLFITYGAIVLTFASPLSSWATSTIDRRTLLVGTMLLTGVAHLAMAVASGYWAIMLLRLLMLTVIAVFTPQAASAVAQLVAEKERPSAIAFVFIGWSLAVAAGLPLVTFLASTLGWHWCFGLLGASALLCAVLLSVTLPRGLMGSPFSLANWGDVVRDRLILLLLVMTALHISGQFVIITFMGPLLTALAGASASVIATFFALYGFGGFFGSILAARVVGRLGAYATSGIALGAILCGLLLWVLGSGVLVVMAIGVAVWGVGFASVNSMQQARLYIAAPALAGVTVALNSSAIYVGQAAGSWIGGLLFSYGYVLAMGYVASLLVLAALGLWLLSRPRGERSSA